VLAERACTRRLRRHAARAARRARHTSRFIDRLVPLREGRKRHEWIEAFAITRFAGIEYIVDSDGRILLLEINRRVTPGACWCAAIVAPIAAARAAFVSDVAARTRTVVQDPLHDLEPSRSSSSWRYGSPHRHRSTCDRSTSCLRSRGTMGSAWS
jgi:hypothetical protein